MLYVNHTTQANKGKLFGLLRLEFFLVFVKRSKGITKGLGFHPTNNTAYLQNTVYTTLPAATVIIAHIDQLHLFVPMLTSSPETHSKIKNSIKECFTLSFDFWTTERRVNYTQLVYQFDIGSAQDNESSKWLISAHQTSARSVAPNRANNTAFFDNLVVRKYFVKIDGISYPRDSVNEGYKTFNYLDQYRDFIYFI